MSPCGGDDRGSNPRRGIMFPEIITFRITSRCNYNCKYCYGPKNIEELPLNKLKEIFSILSKMGAKAIVLTGGEPLVREDIKDIIKEIRKNNLKIFLDTNGSLFFKYNHLIDENIDVLGLPIDFVKSSYRDSKQLETVIKILEYYKNKTKKPIIRIGTVLTKENSEDIEKIGDLIMKYPIDIWKIYEFLPQNANALINRKELEIQKEEFDNITKIMVDKFSRHFKVAISNRKSRNKAYFFINPDGNVFMPVDNGDICKEETIGNIFDKDILAKWKDVISESNYNQNIQDTFRID